MENQIVNSDMDSVGMSNTNLENPDVSVIIPVYNVEEFIKEFLESVTCQKFVNIEIILIDDGSTDNSAAICEEYSKIDSRIIFICQENKGVSVSRNHGIDIARGKYITFADPDDILSLVFCETVNNNVEDSDFVIFNADYLDENGEHASEWRAPDKFYLTGNDVDELKIFLFRRGNDSKDYLLMGEYFIPFMGTSWAKVYKRDILEKFNIRFLPGVHPAEDVLFNFDYLTHCDKVGIFNIPIYKYRTRASSSTHSARYDRYENMNKCFTYLQKNYLLDDALSIEFKKAIYVHLFRHLWFVLSKQTFNKDCYPYYRDSKREFIAQRHTKMCRDIVSNVDASMLSKKMRIMYLLYRKNLPMVMILVRRIYDELKKGRKVIYRIGRL